MVVVSKEYQSGTEVSWLTAVTKSKSQNKCSYEFTRGCWPRMRKAQILKRYKDEFVYAKPSPFQNCGT